MAEHHEVKKEQSLMQMLVDNKIARNEWHATALIASWRVTVNHNEVDIDCVVYPGDIVRVYQ